MCCTKIFLLLGVIACLDALTLKQRLNALETKLETIIDNNEMESSEFEDKIHQIIASRCDFQCSNLTKETKSNGEEMMPTNLDNINKTITDEIKKVYSFVEKNSQALVDEFQNTLTVLMNQHRNMNQKIRINSRIIRKLEEKPHRSLSNENDNIKKFEHKISVLDDDLEKMMRTVAKQSEHIDEVGQHLLKLDRRDDDFRENIDRNFRGVSGLDHNLVEIERRYREFALDLDTFKDNTRKDIEEIQAKLHIDKTDRPPKTKTCNEGWFKHESKCFMSIDVGVNWKTALSRCQDLNAKLAEPETEDEMGYLQQSFQGWIGASDKDMNGTFLWESSDKVLELRLKIPNNPHSRQYRYCVYISKKKIRVERCFIHFHYICEKEVL